MKISLHRAKMEDLPVILEIFRLAIERGPAGLYTEQQKAVWLEGSTNLARWEKAVKEQHFMLARIGEEIGGFGSLKEGDYIDFLYTHPFYQKMGIGGIIMEELLREARKQNVALLSSHVSLYALNFFVSHSFTVVREVENHRRGVVIRNFLMQRLLS